MSDEVRERPGTDCAQECAAVDQAEDAEEEPAATLKNAIVKIIIVGAPILIEEIWRWLKRRPRVS